MNAIPHKVLFTDSLTIKIPLLSSNSAFLRPKRKLTKHDRTVTFTDAPLIVAE